MISSFDKTLGKRTNENVKINFPVFYIFENYINLIQSFTKSNKLAFLSCVPENDIGLSLPSNNCVSGLFHEKAIRHALFLF